MTEAKTIDEVILQLTAIVEDAKLKNSRIGYFAALYRQVTISVKQHIDAGDYFDDNARMERFDIIFANRYLAAVHALQSGGAPTQVWAYAFDVAPQWPPIALQHILLGINAHIGLDLGVAAYETAGGAAGLPALRGDFDKINALLGDLVAQVKNELATVWPPLRWLNRYLGAVEDLTINFSMKIARDAAWAFAEDLARDGGSEAEKIARRDEKTVAFSRMIRHPGVGAAVVLTLVRLGEIGSPAKIIVILEDELKN
jgi:hypothetical protein